MHAVLSSSFDVAFLTHVFKHAAFLESISQEHDFWCGSSKVIKASFFQDAYSAGFLPMILGVNDLFSLTSPQPQPTPLDAQPQPTPPPDAQPQPSPPDAQPQPSPPDAQPQPTPPPDAQPQPTPPPDAQPQPSPLDAQPLPNPLDAQPQPSPQTDAQPQNRRNVLDPFRNCPMCSSAPEGSNS